MKKYGKWLGVLGISLLVLSGCSVLNKPYLYGNKSCGANKTAYVYANGKAAICLDEKSVAYMVCSRELGINSEENITGVKGSVSVPIEKVIPELKVEGNNTVKITYADTGELATARAKAIQTCVDIYNTYQSISVNGAK